MPSGKYLATARRLIRANPDLFEALVEFEHTRRMPKLGRKVHVDFTLDADLVRELRREAAKRGLKMSPVVEQLVRNQVKGWRQE
jgi:hypothetical protein